MRFLVPVFLATAFGPMPTDAADFLPTLCRLAGADLPNDYTGDGEDISDMLMGTMRPCNRPIHWEWRFRMAGYPIHHSPILAIRDGDWKLLLNPDRSRVELYNIPDDWLELNNLAGPQPEVVERLSQQALDWQATLTDGPLDPTAGQISYGWPE